MDAKLTLKFDKQVVEKAKEYASKHNKSLSRIIESYLQLLTSKTEEQEEIVVSDFVKGLSIKTNLSTDFDYKKEYGNHLTEKYN